MWLTIDENDSRPIYRQIVRRVKEQVHRGSLPPGYELPSVRELAESLGVNMHTVRAAYLKLRDEGVITMRLGRRARIARQPDAPSAAAEQALGSRLKELITDALLMGLSSDDFLKLADRQLQQLKKD